jgi:hypothetical protein
LAFTNGRVYVPCLGKVELMRGREGKKVESHEPIVLSLPL